MYAYLGLYKQEYKACYPSTIRWPCLGGKSLRVWTQSKFSKYQLTYVCTDQANNQIIE